jgi:hypothetical protein
MGALPQEEIIINTTYDPEERLAEERLSEGLTKEGGGRRDGCPGLMWFAAWAPCPKKQS